MSPAVVVDGGGTLNILIVIVFCYLFSVHCTSTLQTRGELLLKGLKVAEIQGLLEESQMIMGSLVSNRLPL